MLFNSYVFLFVYLPIVFAGFFLLGHRGKRQLATLWLVLSSLFFYGFWDIKYVPLLMISIIFNYLVGKYLENHLRHKAALTLGIIGNVLLLGYFKYMDFFIANVNMMLGESYSLLYIVLPLGISFFTFTQTAYLVDAYRGEAKNESFLLYCEFVTIFPHLIAGPIINHKKMMPQFVAPETFKLNYHNIAMGLSLLAMGLFKKVLIADTLGEWASPVFANADKITFLEAWIGALAYTLQLYIDFSAYSEMAIGLGLMFNLRLPVNFNSPYQATSIIDFWRRWHMTLGDWVKNYLYIPMGGNRHGEWRKMRNLFVSMLIIGLWHGAGWTFVLWGGIHGVLLMLNHQWRRLNITLPHFVNWAMTFICVLVCWVVFRADNIQAAGDMLFTMVDIQHIALPTEIWCQEMFADSGIPFVSWHVGKDLQNSVISLTLLMIAVLKMKNPVVLLGDFRPNGKWFAAVLIMLLVALCQLNNYTEFLYFQF